MNVVSSERQNHRIGTHIPVLKILCQPSEVSAPVYLALMVPHIPHTIIRKVLFFAACYEEVLVLLVEVQHLLDES